jgi:hypothetical protein
MHDATENEYYNMKMAEINGAFEYYKKLYADSNKSTSEDKDEGTRKKPKANKDESTRKSQKVNKEKGIKKTLSEEERKKLQSSFGKNLKDVVKNNIVLVVKKCEINSRAI